MSVTRSLIADVYDSPILRVCDGPAPERACLSTELQQLYADAKFAEILAQADACLPKDMAGNFIAEQEKSDVVHDLLAFLAERMLEYEQAETAGDQRLPGLAGGLCGGQSGEPDAQDEAAELLRARL